MVLLTAIEYLRDEQIENQESSETFQLKKEEAEGEELETEEAWSITKPKRSKADMVAILLLVGEVLCFFD